MQKKYHETNELLDNNHFQVETQNSHWEKIFLIDTIESPSILCSNTFLKNAQEKKYKIKN